MRSGSHYDLLNHEVHTQQSIPYCTEERLFVLLHTFFLSVRRYIMYLIQFIYKCSTMKYVYYYSSACKKKKNRLKKLMILSYVPGRSGGGHATIIHNRLYAWKNLSGSVIIIWIIITFIKLSTIHIISITLFLVTIPDRPPIHLYMQTLANKPAT